MEALKRAIQSTSTRLEDYRIQGKRTALRVFSTNCGGCDSFEKRRPQYESNLSVDMIFDLCTDDASNLRMALQAGATRIPCYIILEDNTHKVARP